MVDNYANVGKTRNLAQSLPLYTNTYRFLQTFIPHSSDKCLIRKPLCKTMNSAKSAKLCKTLLLLQTFGVKPLIFLFAAKTVQMRTSRHRPNRRKDVVFAKNILPDYSINSVVTDSYENSRNPFLRTFSQLLRNFCERIFSLKMNRTNGIFRSYVDLWRKIRDALRKTSGRYPLRKREVIVLFPHRDVYRHQHYTDYPVERNNSLSEKIGGKRTTTHTMILHFKHNTLHTYSKSGEWTQKKSCIEGCEKKFILICLREGNSRNMKILHIINSFDLGGNERFLVYLLERLDRKKFQQEVCVPDRGKDRTLYLKDVCDELGLPIYILPTKGNFDRTLKRRLCELIGRDKYDVVHTHLPLSQYYGRKAAIKMGVPCIISSEQNTYHHKTRIPFSLIERSLAKKTSKIIACSESVRDHLIDKVMLPPTKIKVIWNSVDTNVFKPVEDRDKAKKAIYKRFHIPEDRMLGGVVAHLSTQKGHDSLLRALPHVLKTVPNFHLLLVGDGDLKDSLVLLAEELGIMKHVTFAGVQEDIASILNALDIFMLPSLWEGFGIAAIEAMACRIPVIVSYVGGLKEIVTDRDNGLVISRSYPEGIAKAILRLATDEKFRDRLAARGLETVREKFDVADMVRKVEKVYLSCVKTKA